MAKDTDITYHEMEKAAGKLDRAEENLTNTLDRLQSYIEELVNNGYTTRKGSQAFDENFKEFTRGAKETLHGLKGMSDFLNKAKQAYEDLDEQLAKSQKG
jgi:WXG100 family type VII secretion target